MVSLSDTAKEVAYELGKVDKSVTHEYIIEHTSIENVSESKEALRELIDFGLITTTPGFTYRLAHNEQADDFRTKS